MEFILDVSLARSALSRIFDVAPIKTLEGDTVGVKVEATKDNNVLFSVNGAGVVASSKIEADVNQIGFAIVSLSVLYKAIMGFTPFNSESGVGTDTLKIRVGSQSLTITAKTVYKDRSVRQRRIIQFLDTSVSNLKIISEDRFIDLPINILATGLKKVLFSASSGTDTSGFAGVLVEVFDGRIKFVSMNGVCLTEYSCALPKKSHEIKCMLDSEFVSKLTKVLYKLSKENPERQLRLLITDRMFLFKCADFTVGVPVMVGTFPDYSSLLKIKRKTFVVSVEILLDNLRNIMFNSDKEDDFRASLNFHDGELHIRTLSCENEGIRLEGDAEGNLHIDFNIL
ncbi:MAG: hypothetical protein KAS32_31100, partial [Candidatus Peribacteraceae bacterium]|nr:hypothetical protein [Candidatus Peribacteraceae bacterium]